MNKTESLETNVTYDSLSVLVVVAIFLLVDIVYLDILLAFFLILLYSYKKEGIKKELGFDKPDRPIRLLGWSILLAVLIVCISFFVFLPVIESITNEPLALGMFEQLRNNPELLLISLVLGWVVGGLIEETIFRSFLISRFINVLGFKIGAATGIIGSSILFGYLHTYQGISGQLLTGFVGLLLALVFVINNRNIWLNILTHGFVNTFSMLLLYFEIIKPG